MGINLPHLMNCLKKIIVSIHRKNLQALEMEIYKVSNNMSTTILNDIFASRATLYDLRNLVSFKM